MLLLSNILDSQNILIQTLSNLMLTIFSPIHLSPPTSPNRKRVHCERTTVCDRIRGSTCNAAAAHEDAYRCIQMFDELQLLEPIPALALSPQLMQRIYAKMMIEE